jgi:hypothetical protein
VGRSVGSLVGRQLVLEVICIRGAMSFHCMKNVESELSKSWNTFKNMLSEVSKMSEKGS